MRADRGLDPAWASNPGRDRERILADRLIGSLDAADEALARAGVEQVAGSPLLERQLSPMKRGGSPRGDLPVAYLEREWRDSLSLETRLVRLTGKTARKQRRNHRGLAAADYRSLLPETLREAQLVLRETGHFGREREDLVFFRFRADGRIFKAVVERSAARVARLATFHQCAPATVAQALLPRAHAGRARPAGGEVGAGVRGVGPEPPAGSAPSLARASGPGIRKSTRSAPERAKPESCSLGPKKIV